MFSSAVTLFIITVETHLSLCGANGSGFAPELHVPWLLKVTQTFLCAAVTIVSQSFSPHLQFIVWLAWWVLAGFPFESLLCCIPILCWALLDQGRLTGHAGKLLTHSVSWLRKWSSYTVHEKSLVLELPIPVGGIWICIHEGSNISRILLTMDLHVFLYPYI